MATEEQKIVANIENLKKQYENLDLAIQYMLENNQLPGTTPEEVFLNQVTTPNVQGKIAKYEEQKQQIDNLKKQWESELKRVQQLKEQLAPAEVKYEELEAQEREKTRERKSELQRMYTLNEYQLKQRLKFYDESDEQVKQYRNRLKDISIELSRSSELPPRAGANLKIKKAYKGISHKIRAQWLRTRLQELQQRNPKERRDILMSQALEDYEDQFPKGIDPSGREALLQEPANLSIDWQTSTLIDPKTNIRRKMTTEERDKFKWKRQVVHTPERAKTKLLQHAKAQSYFNTMSTALSKRLQEQTKAMERLGISAERMGWEGVGLLGTNILKTIRAGDVRDVIGLTEKNQPTPEEMQQYPELRELNEQTNAALKEYQRAKAQKDAIDPRNEGSLAKSGAVIESEFARGMRVATGLASLATIQGLRSLSKKTDDPNKPAEDFEVFELGKAAPTILLPPEEGGLSNPEARAAAIATMPMFMEFNKYYPKQQSTPAWIYGTGALAFATDIFMPVGPDAALIAMTPYTGGASLVGMGATKSGKLGAALAKGTAKTLKYTPKPKTAAVLKTGMEILEVADEVFETTATLGMNKINRQALKAASGAVALRQANIMLKEARKGKELSYKNVFEEPDTIRDMAAREVASPIGDSIDLQIKLRNAKSIAEVKDIQKRLVPDSIPDRVANKIIQTENLNAKYVDGLFNDELKTATKDVTDDAIRVGMYLGQKIPRMVSDASVLQISNNVYEQAFKNNVFLRSILGDSFDPNPDKLAYIRNELLKAEKVGSGAVDNFVDDIVLREARARPEIISKAAEDVIADMVSERLFSRAPNNSVFFSRSLLIDKRIASNPEFQNKVRTALKAYPVNVNAKGDIVFNNGANVLNNLIVELGPTPFRRSPKWKSIAKGLMDDKGFNVRDYSLIADSLKAREAKRIIKRDYPKSRAQTARYLSPEAYKYASEPFIRSGQTFGAKINAVAKRVNESLPKKWQSKSLKAGDVEAIPFQRLENNLREMTGSEFNNLVRELQSHPKKTSRNKVFSDALNTTQQQYVNQATKEIRALWDSLRPYDEYGTIASSRIERFMENHFLLRNVDEDVIVKLKKQADEFDGLRFEEIIEAVDIDKSYKNKFIEDFLKGFYDNLPNKPGAFDEHVIETVTKLSDQPLTIRTFEEAIKEMRVLNDAYKGGLAKFKLPFKFEDAVEELVLARIVKERAAIKFDSEMKALFEENPWIKSDLIGNAQSSVKNEVKWEASQVGTNISVGAIREITANMGGYDEALNDLFKTIDGEYSNPQLISFIDNITNAFKNIETKYTKLQTMKKLSDDLTKAVIRNGYEGLQKVIREEIEKTSNTELQNALKSLKTGIEKSIFRVEKDKLRAKYGIKPIPKKVRDELNDAKTKELKNFNEAQNLNYEKAIADFDNILKRKYDLPVKRPKLTPSQKSAADKELWKRRRQWNKDLFVQKYQPRKDKIKQLMDEVFPTKTNKATEAQIEVEIIKKLQEIEKKHKRKRDLITLQLANDPLRGSKLFKFNYNHYIVKWDQIDNYMVDQYIKYYHPDLKNKEEFIEYVRDGIYKFDAEWKTDRAIKRREFIEKTKEELGLAPSIDAKAAAQKKKYKEELKDFKSKLKEIYKNNSKQKADEITTRLGIKRKTAEQRKQLQRKVLQESEKIDVTKAAEVQQKLDKYIKNIKENSEVFHPAKRLGDEIINNLQAKGIDVFKRNPKDVISGANLQLKKIDRYNVQVMFGKDFANTFDKAKKNLENGTFAKSFETLQGRNKEEFRKKAWWWFTQSVDFFRQQTVGGLLGGYGTLRYATLNALSAPFMMAMTRGIPGAAEDLGMGLYNLSRRLKPDDVMFTDVNGLSWTKKQMDELERRYPLAASQAGAELDNSNIRYLLETVNQKEGGFARLVHGATPLAARNYVARFADFTDSYFRKLVFRNGIRRGLAPAAAAREAKDALFDYSKARGGEIDRFIGQAIYFWSFQRESFRSVIDAVASGKASQLLHSYRAMNHLFHDEELKATGSNFDAARLYRYLTTDFEGKKGIAGGFAVPAFESIGVMAEGLSLALHVVQTALSGGNALEATGESGERLIKNVIERKPFYPLINAALEATEYAQDEASRKGFYVPNYVVSGMPDWAWPTFKEKFDVVPVPIKDRRENKASRVDEEGNPQHWRFKSKKDQKHYDLMQSMLLGFGLQRTIDDNILKSGAILKTAKPGKDEPYPYSASGSLLDLLMFQAAMKTYLQFTPARAQIERTQKRKEAGIRSQGTK